MRKKQSVVMLLLMLCLLFALPATVSAYKNQWITTGDGTYYYGSNGKKYVGGPKKIKSGGKTYYYVFDSTGKLIKNSLSYNRTKKKYYYSLSNGRLLTTFKKIGGKYYCGTKTGVLKTGFQKVNKKYYYFQPAALTKATKKVNGRTYYFGANGQAVKSKFVTIGNARYYFDSTCRRVYGLQKIGKYYYYFSKKNCKQVYGWQKANGSYYYFNKANKGRALTGGFKTINKKQYYFNSFGQQVRGWLVLGNKRYYMDPKKNGARTTGTKKINGKTYKFGKKGYVTYKSTGNYTIRVNRKKCVVTIYDGNTPVKAMTCSVGRPGNSTPTGVFYIQSHYRWWMLDGPTMGQYCSHFLPSYLFHSIPMDGTSRNPYNVAAYKFNQLGQPASGGCIRLCVADSKWIYDNAPIGTKVVISDSEATPLGKPVMVKMKSGTIGKDPTDKWS